MKKPLIIVGAGNVGGFLSYNIQEFSPDYDILGFLDDDPDKIGTETYGRKVLGSVSEIARFEKTKISVAIGIANPIIKKKIVEKLSNYNFEFPSFVSKNVWLSSGVKPGKGNILYPGVSINYETSLGDFVIINLNCAIGHNCTISNYSTLAPGVSFAGFTYLEEAVEVGIGASTRQNVRIGSKAIIGGQTMVLKDVEVGSCVAGIPGKKLFSKK